jgi:hypothetical protein
MTLSNNNGALTAVRVAAASILSVFAVYLIVLSVGDPITSFGDKETSFLYAILVFIPVAVVCLYALTRRAT